MNIAQFLVEHPEFNSADLNLVQATLTAALLEIDPSVWRAKADQGQAYLTCMKLARSPFGQNARLVAKDGSTVYDLEYRRLVGQVSSGFRST